MTTDAGLQKKISLWIIITTALGVVGVVWTILSVSNANGSPALMPRSAPWLGIHIDPNSVGEQSGVAVASVLAGSPALDAGLLPGDVIQRVDQTVILQPIDLMHAIGNHQAGDTIRLTVAQHGIQRKLHIKLKTRSNAYLVAAVVPTADSRPWIGVDVQSMGGQLAKHFGAPDSQGIVVSHVYSGSPAAKAGLVQGDILKRIGATRLRDASQLKSVLATKKSGDTLRLSIWHQQGAKDVRLTLGTRADLPPLIPQPLPEPEVETEAAWLGLDVLPLTRAEAEEFGLPAGLKGVIVGGLAAGAGVDAGFLAGDVIVAVNGEATPNMRTFAEAAEGAIGAVVDVVRGGRHVYLSIPPPDKAPGQKSPLKRVRLQTWQ